MKHGCRSRGRVSAASSQARRQKQQGIAMLVVMLVLLMVTATGIFGAYAASYEIRAAGHGRQAMQTQYVGETALMSTVALVDQIGASALLYAMANTTPPPMGHFEPALLPGKRSYRVYQEDFANLLAPPVDRESFGGMQHAYEPFYVIDVNDDYTFTGTIPGQRADGYARVRYLYATYTSRGRTRLADGDNIGVLAGERQFHEGASDARSHATSGPFGF